MNAAEPVAFVPTDRQVLGHCVRCGKPARLQIMRRLRPDGTYRARPYYSCSVCYQVSSGYLVPGPVVFSASKRARRIVHTIQTAVGV